MRPGRPVRVGAGVDRGGVRCVVVAPSKLERPLGDRVKTDKRDAARLARLLHIGQLPAMRVPTETEEAARGAGPGSGGCPCRSDEHPGIVAGKLLLRHGIADSGGHARTVVREQWLRGRRFAQPGLLNAFDEAFETVLATLARRDRLDSAIGVMAATGPWASVVTRLVCVRGIATQTGFGLATEIGDWHPDRRGHHPQVAQRLSQAHRVRHELGGGDQRRWAHHRRPQTPTRPTTARSAGSSGGAARRASCEQLRGVPGCDCPLRWPCWVVKAGQLTMQMCRCAHLGKDEPCHVDESVPIRRYSSRMISALDRGLSAPPSDTASSP